MAEDTDQICWRKNPDSSDSDIRTREYTLEEEAYRVSEATNDDGTVDVEITNVEKDGDEAVVEFLTPMLEEESETMKWPSRDHPEYKLVRICEESIGSFEAVTQLEGEKIRANKDNWSLVTKEESNEPMVNREHMVYAGYAVGGIGIVSALITGFFLLGLVVLYPFGVFVINIWQGLALLFGATVVFLVSAIITAIADDLKM